jgi:HEPN domain-containing protein
MINVAKQIEYWCNTAENDIETASILIKSGKYIEGMFFCHLSIEKIVKALVVKQTENIPVRSHDLFYLSEIAKIEIAEEQSNFMQILMKYQLEGRYPEFYPKVPSLDKINDYLNRTKNLMQCFKKML